MFTEFFYTLPEDVSENTIVLREKEAHHVNNVLRKRVGDSIKIIDGLGNCFVCRITSIVKNQITTNIINRENNKPSFDLILAVGIPKKDKFEWILEKGTELGVTHFIPLLTERTQMKAKSINGKRCNLITISAMKQSCRTFLPVLEHPQRISDFIKTTTDYDFKLLAHEKTKKNSLQMISPDMINNSLHKSPNIVIMIGPEGGFTDREVEIAVDAGYTSITLGEHRLRTETAALVAATLVLNKMRKLG